MCRDTLLCSCVEPVGAMVIEARMDLYIIGMICEVICLLYY
jgi:hypothetical protein